MLGDLAVHGWVILINTTGETFSHFLFVTEFSWQIDSLPLELLLHFFKDAQTASKSDCYFTLDTDSQTLL